MKKIHVTQANIERSCKRDSGHCMIADAVRLAIPEAQYILVDLQSIRYSLPSISMRFLFLTPPMAQRQIVRFDRGTTVQPFSFVLPDAISSRPMGWAGQRPAHQTRKGKKYVKTGKPRRIVAYRERAYGLRLIPE